MLIAKGIATALDSLAAKRLRLEQVTREELDPRLGGVVNGKRATLELFHLRCLIEERLANLQGPVAQGVRRGIVADGAISAGQVVQGAGEDVVVGGQEVGADLEDLLEVG